MPMIRSLLTACCLLPALGGGLHAQPRFTDAERAAAEDPDFRYQAEYAGRIEGAEFGFQVSARGEGKFWGLLSRGGLPGDGWDGSEQIALTAERQGDRLEFEHESQILAYADRSFAVSRGAESVGTLKRVERESPDAGRQPPAGAVVLFDGDSLEAWQPNARIVDGLLASGARTRQAFGDMRLYLEFMVPHMPGFSRNPRGNSGIYIQQRYEVQIHDSLAEAPSPTGVGSLYNYRTTPVNACYPPLRWQTFDIRFIAPRFDAEGHKTADARITVRHNGVLIHDDVELTRGTGAGESLPEVPLAALELQGKTAPVRFRNIWLIEEDPAAEAAGPVSADTENR